MSELDLVQVSAPGQALAQPRASGSLSVLPPPVLLQAARRASGDLRLVMRQPASGGVAVVVFRGGEPTMVFQPGDGRTLGELLLDAGAIDLATLDQLVDGRVRGAHSLEDLLQAKTSVPPAMVRRYLDFQARSRLLDVLAWREGFFELQGYRGGGETAFRLELPSLDALTYRAQARAKALPGLLAKLPTAPANTIVRRRRGGARPADQFALDVLALLEEPLLIPQVVARLLVDDDLVIDAVVRMAEARAVALRPRVELAEIPAAAPTIDPRVGDVLREVVSRVREGAFVSSTASLTVVVLAASAADAVQFVARLEGGHGEPTPLNGPAGTTGLASRTLTLAPNARLHLLAIRPEALSRGALEGVLARFDALLLLRSGDDPEELDRLRQLRDVARRVAGREPLTLGVDLGKSLRDWAEYPDAVLGLTDWESRPAAWLVERLVEALLATTNAR